MAVSTGWQTLTYGTDLTWSSAVPAGSLGNGSATLRYKRSDGYFYINFQFVAGSTTTFGGAGASWQWQLPAEIGENSPYAIGGAWARDLNATVGSNADYAGIAIVQNVWPFSDGDRPKLFTLFGTAAKLTMGTHPFTWSAGSTLKASVIVEAFDN